MSTKQTTKSLPEITFREFLEAVPPGVERDVTNLHRFRGPDKSLATTKPKITLYCHKCRGDRSFTTDDSNDVDINGIARFFLIYFCANCDQNVKTFALLAWIEPDGKATALKFGEYPAFGAVPPNSIMKLLNKADGVLFLQGLRAE